MLGERVQSVKRICEGEQTDSVIFADDDYFAEHREELENKAKDGCRLIVVTNKPLHILGEDIIFRVHTLEEEVRANNFVARSESNKFSKEFAEMDFQNTDVRNNYLSFSYTVNGKKISYGTVLFTKPKHFRFVDPKIRLRVEGDSIILRKHQPNCIICGEDKNLLEYKGRLICKTCIKTLNKKI